MTDLRICQIFNQSTIRNRMLGWLGSNQISAVREPDTFPKKEGGPKDSNGRQSNNG
jgi:hypothetical protein